MQARVKLGLALLAAAFSGSVLAVQPQPVGTSPQGASAPDVAKTPTPPAPVPIPYPNAVPQSSAQQETPKNNSTFKRSTGDEASGGVMQFNPKELTIKKDVPAAGPLPLTPLDRPIAREPGKIEIPNVQAVRPVPPPPAPAAGGWPAKIQGPTMVDKSGEARRAPAKIDAITIKQK